MTTWDKPVYSDMVASIGYNDETNELIVTFNKGRKYVYAGVPEELAVQLANAPSVGQMMNSEIKPNYPAREL